METNYTIIAVVLVLAIVLIVYLNRRNKKDLTEYEQQTNLSELHPEKHDDEDKQV